MAKKNSHIPLESYQAAVAWLEETAQPDYEPEYGEGHFEVKYKNMTNAQAKHLALLLADHPHVDTIVVGNSTLRSEGAIAFIEATKKNPNIHSLCLLNNPIGVKGVEAAIDLVASKQDLARLWIMGCEESIHRVQEDKMSEAITTPPHPCLQSIMFGGRLSNKSYDIIEKNKELSARKVAAICSRPDSMEALAAAYGRSGMLAYYQAIQTNADRAEQIFDFREKIRVELPDLKLSDPPTLEELQTPIRDGHAFTPSPLEHPEFWEQFSEIAEKLSEAGTPITKSLLLQPNRDGDPILISAIATGHLDDVMKSLHAQGERLTADDLLKGQEEFSSLIDIALKYGRTDQLFTAENWRDATRSELRAVLKSIPEHMHQEIPNLHQLSTHITRNGQWQTRER